MPVFGPDGKRTDDSVMFKTDEVPRETSLEALGELKPVARKDGVHTAGTSSQIADGAAAVLLMTASKAAELGLKPMARVLDAQLVGCDPVLMLEGPIPATEKMLDKQDFRFQILTFSKSTRHSHLLFCLGRKLLVQTWTK